MPLKISIFFQPLPRFFFILNIIFVIWVVLLSFLAPIGQKRYQILPFESLHHLADRKSYNILIWQKYGIRQKRKASNVENRFSRSVGRLPENIMFQLVFYYNGYGSHLSSLWILYTPNQGQIGKWPCSYFWINTNIVKHIEQWIKYILIRTEGTLRLPMTYDNHPIHPKPHIALKTTS